MKSSVKASIISLFFITIYASEFDYYSFNESVKSVQSKRYVNSFISFIEGLDGARYVVKQYKYSPVTILLATTITELVAIELGHKAAIPIDVTYLVPAGIECKGKEIAMPASLHLHVAGIRFDKYKGAKYKDIMICQKDNIGLTRAIITHMSCHRDIAMLAAYDTLIGNNDRNSRNYFYDEITDSFIGIDMGAAFRRDLCKPSQETLNDLLNDELPPLSQDERRGLKIYRDTLLNLIICCTAESLCSMIEEYAKKSGIYNEAFFPQKSSDRFHGYLNHCQRTLRKSYQEAERLIELIDMLFEKIEVKTK